MHLNPNNYIHVLVQLDVRRRGWNHALLSLDLFSVLSGHWRCLRSPTYPTARGGQIFVSIQLTSTYASTVLRQPPCKPHDSHGPPCHVLAHNTNTPRIPFRPSQILINCACTVHISEPRQPLSQFLYVKRGSSFLTIPSHPIITHAMPCNAMQCNALSHLHQGKSPAAVAEQALDMP
jgi:hypothetical protein